MRPIIYLIIIGAAAYLGFNYYNTGKLMPTSDAPPAVEETSSAPASLAESKPAPVVKAVPAFVSKIKIPEGAPGEKHLAKPGIFYVLERTSIEHETGVAAVIPGDEVALLERKPNGVLRVIAGEKYRFELKESQVTNDLDVAQEAERKFVMTHPLAKP